MSSEARQQLAEQALATARAAAREAMAGFRSRPSVELKGARDLVTEYDLRSEREARTQLAALTPDIPVLGEELGSAAGSSALRGLYWAVDPIDGTTNFAHGHPVWGVSVGLVHDGDPLLGAVVAPALALEWWGYRGRDEQAGAVLRNGEPCAVSTVTRLEAALVATGFPTDAREAPRNNLDSFCRVKLEAQAVRRCGACCIDLCFVADGTYDAYWERPLFIWDAAAGAALVLAAGGRVTALDGGSVDLTRGHLLASNGHVHEQLMGPILGEHPDGHEAQT